MNADEYGAREALLRHADILFDEAGMRALASRFEADLDKAPDARGAAERHDHAVYKAAAAIGLIADALRDPDLSTRTTLRYSPNPNPLQKEHFVQRYIRYGRPGRRWRGSTASGDFGRSGANGCLRRPMPRWEIRPACGPCAKHCSSGRDRWATLRLGARAWRLPTAPTRPRLRGSGRRPTEI